jgi:hypothetical protein
MYFVSDGFAMRNAFKMRTLIVALILFAVKAQAVTLSKEALYYRCYQQLTGERPMESDPNLATFRSGSGDPIGVCINMLRAAQLGSAGQISDINSRQLKRVLHQMHNLHATFFKWNSFELPVLSGPDEAATGDMIDTTTPALFYTRALFDPNVSVSSIVTGSEYIRPIRTNMNPTIGPLSNTGGFLQDADGNSATTGDMTTDLAKLFPFGLSGGFFTPMGELLGVSVAAPKTYSYSWQQVATRDAAGKPLTYRTINESFQIGESLGGGVIGSEAYLLLTVRDLAPFQADVLKMPRKFAGAVYKDLLCRDFPLVRAEDAAPFVVTSETLPYRNANTCTQCHSSMDRAASLIRGFYYYRPGGGIIRPAQFKIRTPTLAAPSPAWPSEKAVTTGGVSQYALTPPHGTVFFRSASTGNLVNVDVTSLEQFGQTIAQQDDFYMCIANRYWDYFTNKGVKLNDALLMQNYSATDKAHLATVKQLATSLKTSQKLMGLIEAIMRLPAYSDSAFGQ